MPFRRLARLRSSTLRGLMVAAMALGAGCASFASDGGVLGPRPVPTPRTGLPMTGIIELGLAAQMLDLAEPEPSPRAHIPRWQGRADFRFRSRGFRRSEFGIILERAFAADATRLMPDAPETGANASGAGLSFHYPMPYQDGRLRIGWGVDYLVYLVPYVGYEPCDGCPEPYTVSKRARELTSVVSLSASPSYELTRSFAVFGSVTLRNQPMAERTLSGKYDVDSGDFGFTFSGGASYTHAGTGLRLSLHVYQSVRFDAAGYMPALMAGAELPLFRPRVPSSRPLR